MNRANLPHKVSGGEDVLENPEINKILSLFRLIHNPLDNLLFFQVLNLSFGGISSLDLFKISRLIHQQKISFYELICEQNYWHQKTTEKEDCFIELENLPAILLFKENFLNWRKDMSNLSFSQFFEKVAKESGFLSYLLAKKDFSALDIFRKLFAEIKKLFRGNQS